MRYREFRIVENEPRTAFAEPTDSQEPEQESTGLEAGPPYPQEDVESVRNMQTKLQQLGYSVGSTGVDGKYGPRTTRAVRAFKTDNDIQGDGLSMDPSALEKLNTAERVENPTPTGNERQTSSAVSFNPEELAALDFGGADNDRAKAAAEEFLGRAISDADWNMLVRATVAEASPNQQERAAVMAVILNRVRSSNFPSTISGVLTQQNQFQAVTGTPRDRSPSRWFSNPTQQQVAGVVQAAIDHLEDANNSWLNFTSNNPRAYGAGTNINFMYAMRQSPGAEVIGQTVFGTV